MEIIDYFSSKNQKLWLSKIQKCNWSAARILAKMLLENTFHEMLGWGSFYLLKLPTPYGVLNLEKSIL